MWSVSTLAKRCGLSRCTLLYYESIGLLHPGRNSGNRYRRFSDGDVRRLDQICAYRNAGLELRDILAILKHPDTHALSILKRRLLGLDAEIKSKCAISARSRCCFEARIQWEARTI